MRPVTLDTPRQLYELQHRLAIYCAQCDRWADLSFIQLDRRGLADTSVSRLRFRCGACGEVGEKQVRTPVMDKGAAHRNNYLPTPG